MHRCRSPALLRLASRPRHCAALPHRRWAGGVATMATPIDYETVDVFTDTHFGGNPLAVCFLPPGSAELSTAQMLQITREFNYSESTFVMPPADPAHTARVRIFTPAAEVPFAGHPNVGTAAVLARRGECFGAPIGDGVVFEEQAGLVPLEVLRGDGGSIGATLTAPEPWATLPAAFSAAQVAATVGLDESDISCARHAPLAASVGLPFVLTELRSREALERCANHAQAFAAEPQLEEVGRVFCYVRATAEEAEAVDAVDIRARMFSKRGNEDPATGSVRSLPPVRCCPAHLSLCCAWPGDVRANGPPGVARALGPAGHIDAQAPDRAGRRDGAAVAPPRRGDAQPTRGRVGGGGAEGCW